MSKFRILDTMTRDGRTAYLIGGDGAHQVNDNDPVAISYPAENNRVRWLWKGTNKEKLEHCVSGNDDRSYNLHSSDHIANYLYKWLESHLAADPEPKTVTVECDVIIVAQKDYYMHRGKNVFSVDFTSDQAEKLLDGKILKAKLTFEVQQ